MLTGGVVHGTQLWVNLPRARKMTPPRYQDIRGTQAALLTAPDGGALIRVIARDIAGHAGPGSTRTPIILAHITVEPGAQVDLPWHPGYNALIYALAGAGTVGAEKQADPARPARRLRRGRRPARRRRPAPGLARPEAGAVLIPAIRHPHTG